MSEAVRNAGRMLKEGHVDSVKLEGGREMVATVRAIIAAGIAVMGHIGLTPQSLSKLGGFRSQGRTAEAARRLLDDALALEDAGCYAIVLELSLIHIFPADFFSVRWVRNLPVEAGRYRFRDVYKRQHWPRP